MKKHPEAEKSSNQTSESKESTKRSSGNISDNFINAEPFAISLESEFDELNFSDLNEKPPTDIKS